MKLQLSNVTLVCIDCESIYRSIRVMEHCKELCDFGDALFFTSEPTDYPHVKIESISDPDRVRGLVNYSLFVLTKLHEFIRTEFVLIVQHDGWVLHPDCWDRDWETLDYIGPRFLQDGRVGSGGFSFRSRKLMAEVARIMPPLRGWSFGNTGYAFEDGVICCGLRNALMAQGMRFADPDAASRFAYGGYVQDFQDRPFGFHGFYALDRLLGGTGENIVRAPDRNL